MSGARRVALVAVTVAACALVALGARGDRRADDGAAFELGGGAARVAGGAVVLVTALAVALVAWAMWRPGGPRRPPRRRSWRDVVLPVVIGALLALALASQRPEAGTEAGSDDESTTELGGEARSGEAQPTTDTPSAAASVGIAVFAVAALAAAAAIARRHHRSVFEAGDSTAAYATPDEVSVAAVPPEDLLDAIERERDDRAAILLAFAASERILASTPMARQPTASPREWVRHVRRVARDDDLPSALGALTACYEVARFSDHSIGGDDRRRAVAALHTLARIQRLDSATAVAR